MDNGNEDGYITYSNNKIIKTTDVNLKPGLNGLGHQLFKAMKDHGNKVSQVVAATGETDTYDELLKRCTRTALQMKKLGISENDVVCVCGEDDHLNSCVPLIASLFIGAIPTHLEPRFSAEDVTHLIRQVTPKIVFVVPEGLRLIEEVLLAACVSAIVVVFGATTKYLPFSHFTKENPEEKQFQPIAVEDIMATAFITFSSGTTGLPKGICLNHYRHFVQVVRDEEMGIVSANTIVVNPNSLYWAVSINFLVSVILLGCQRVLTKESKINSLWQYILKYNVTTVLLGNMHAYNIAELPIPQSFESSNNLQNMLITGGRTLKQTVEHLKKILPRTQITPLYGQTEAGHMTLFNPKSAMDTKLFLTKTSSCGRPLKGMSYKVVDIESGINLGPHQPGELRVTSGCVMNRYYREDFFGSFDSDGWLCTGDVVYYDEDFCFFIVDRIKDVLIHKGEHISPLAVEQVILTHPAVKEAIVFGIPHEIDGDLPTALVVLKSEPGKDDIQKYAQDIKKYVDERVDEIKRLRGGLEIVERLSYTSTGKLRRNYIRKMYLARNK